MSPRMDVRRATVAGSFYPGEGADLRQMISSLMNQARVKFPSSALPPGQVKALVVPHAGYIYSGPVAASGFMALNQPAYDKIHLWGPSHRLAFSGLAGAGYPQWETPLGRMEAVDSPHRVLKEAHLREHSLEVELPFLQFLKRKEPLQPILFGDTSPDQALAHLTVAQDDLVVVSTDLSHYHPYDEARKRDLKLLDQVVNGTVAQASGGEACGLTALLTLMTLAQERRWKAYLVDYRNSGDTAGDRKAVVGYASLVWLEEPHG